MPVNRQSRGRDLAALPSAIGAALVASSLSVIYAIPDVEGYRREVPVVLRLRRSVF